MSLFELLVTFTLFASILTLTLYFYGQSMKATRRHDQGSEVYRRAHNLFSDVERFLNSGTLVYATENNLAVAPFRDEWTVADNRLFNWSTQARVLSISELGLMLQEGAEKKPFIELKPWESLSFAPQSFAETERQRRYDYLTLLYVGSPPSETRKGRAYEFKRQVLLVRY
jgi:hypothetical protein